MYRRFAWFALALLLLISHVPASPTQAQGPDSQATISALQTQVAQLTTPQPTGALTQATPASETLAESESASVTDVNVELILDVSGSMGQVVDTGETRLEAAKRVLNEVTAAIPDESGINVGLRIYGHEGDNSEAGRATSCASSDLIVPVQGVARSAIAQGIAPLIPTGWTPIGLSLERSEADFPVSADSTNAVVLVTDGLETCDGDPAAVAAALAASDRGIVTHVIGFALTPEEQQILQAITEASGGMLLEANNATALTGSLFTILDELDVVKGAGFIGGTALSLLPEGDPGQLATVEIGSYDGTTLPFVARNNTGETLVSLSAVGRAFSPAGQLIGTGGDQILAPNLLRAGGLTMGYIYFGGVDLPADTTFEVIVDGIPVEEEEYENQRDLDVVEAAFVDGRVVGTLRNGYDEPLAGAVGVQVACFDVSGAIIDMEKVYTPEKDAEPEQEVTFQAPLIGTFDCPLFLVAGNGFARLADSKAGAILARESAQQESEAPSKSTVAPPVSLTPSPVAAVETAEPQVSVMATPGANGCYDLTTAIGVLNGIQTQGLPIGEFIEYTVETDPNELMGRPGGYISKVNFQDTRLTPETDDFGTQDGGAIEIFATEEDLNDRVARLEAGFDAFPLLPKDVFFSDGTVLLRISTRLLIPDGESYGTALETLASCS